MNPVRQTYPRTVASALVLALAVPLAGCETLEGLISNEQIGALGSGLGCAAISKITGSSDRQAAVAAVVCAAVGYGATKKLEDRRKAFASDEQFYAAESQRLATYERELSGEIDAAKRELAADRMRAEGLIAAAERSDAERTDLRRLNDELEQRQASLDAQLATAQENYKYQRGLVLRMKETRGSTPQAESARLAKLESSVAELRGLVGEHETQTASLGSYL